MSFKVYIGFDSREKIASDVCEYSIKKNSSINIEIKLLEKTKLEKKNLLYRKDDKLSSTEFTFSRFLIPYLNNYKGWAIFCDCDFLWLDDIKNLFEQRDNKYAVMCVQHDYEPKSKTKMDGRQQLLYPRKIGPQWYYGIVNIQKTKKLILMLSIIKLENFFIDLDG